MSEVTGRLGELVAGPAPETLPRSTIERATALVADALACGIGAASTPWGRALVRAAQQAGGAGPATLLSSGASGALLTVAPTNALLINCLDYDDTLFGHPGGPVVATALGVGELVDASGASLLEAVAVGYEIAGRLSEAAAPTPDRRRGAWGTGIHLAPSAAAVAARLLGLSADRCADALALAACTAPVSSVRQSVYGPSGPSMAKNNYGAAVAAGITAALQAREGITGPRDIFDHEGGYAALALTDRWRPDVVVRPPVDAWYVDRVATKPYSCCRKIHASIDGALRLVRAHDIAVTSIRSIVLKSPAWRTSPAFSAPAPTDMAAAQFSAPFCVAASLHGVPAGPAWFEHRTLADPSILATASRVAVEPVDAPDDSPLWTSVTVAADGTHKVEVARPAGDPSNPMTAATLAAKFHHLVGPVVGDAAAAQLHGALGDLVSWPDLAQIALVCGDGSEPPHLTV